MLHLVPYYGNELDKTNRTFNDMMDSFFRTGINRLSEGAFKLDVEKTEDAYIVTADMPGIKKENVALDVENDCLTITVSQTSDHEEKNEEKHYLHRERSVMNASRQIYLEGVDEEGIKAQMDNGVLTVTLPFEREVSNKKVIDID